MLSYLRSIAEMYKLQTISSLYEIKKSENLGTGRPASVAETGGAFVLAATTNDTSEHEGFVRHEMSCTSRIIQVEFIA